MPTSPNEMEEKTYENKRRHIRRKEDREKNRRILHCVKRIVGIEKVFNQEVDELLDLLGLTREELNNPGEEEVTNGNS